MDQVIGEIQKTPTKKTIFSLSNYKGKDFINIRDCFKTDKMTDWQATKSGVTFDYKEASMLVSLTEKIEDVIKKGAVK